MSLHYEWMLSLRLRSDVPHDVVEELRFHLGEASALPAVTTLEHDFPVFEASPDDALPGGRVALLTEQKPYLDRPAVLGLFVRTYVKDDAMYELLGTVPAWLARWSATQGWIGFAREELDLVPWLHFYVQDGHAYAAGPAETPQPLDEATPPFTLGQTTDDLTP